MRTVTLMLSIIAHVIGVCTLILAPLFATDTLPEPRRATEFIAVTPLVPPTPPPVRRAPSPVVVAHRDAAPSEAPIGITPEPPIEPVADVPPSNDGAIVFGSGDLSVLNLITPPSPPLPPPLPRVGGEIKQPLKVVDVAPIYPPIARLSHTEGIVILEAVIGEDGAVRDVRVLRSIPLLDAAAMEAVRQWRFTPTLLNGQPVPVVMTVTVAFRLR